jgi:cell division protein FtsB
MYRLRPFLRFFRNKYLFALTAFTVWMLFFDKNDVFVQSDRRQELRELEESKRYFSEQIRMDRALSQDLKNNPEILEKIAREEYRMKKENEDLFIIRKAEND